MSDIIQNYLGLLGVDRFNHPPVFVRDRAPTSDDIKVQKGYYPQGSFWIFDNGTPGDEQLWWLAEIHQTAYWVLLTDGGTGPVISQAGDDGVEVAPDGTGTFFWEGLTVANGTNPKPVYVAADLPNTEQIQVQVGAAIPAAPADSNDAGLVSVNSAQFSITAEGYVSLVGGPTPPALFLEGDSGGQVGPDGTGTIHVIGQASQAYATVIGVPGSNRLDIRFIEPGSDGELLIGNTGAGAPLVGTLTSPDGSVGIAYNSPNIELTATGADAINIQTFTASDTYTPTAGMKYCIIETQGAGGGGGGASATGAAEVSGGGGGGGGGYARVVADAATIGVSQVVTIGAGGIAGADTGGNGGAGGTTSLGALCAASGGSGGNGGTAGATSIQNGGLGGTGTIGDVFATGSRGTWSWGITGGSVTGMGGSSHYGGATGGTVHTIGGNGITGTNYGGGGGGGANYFNQVTGRTGGVGSSGLCVITEFL